jgi:hypothetical protein
MPAAGLAGMLINEGQNLGRRIGGITPRAGLTEIAPTDIQGLEIEVNSL